MSKWVDGGQRPDCYGNYKWDSERDYPTPRSCPKGACAHCQQYRKCRDAIIEIYRKAQGVPDYAPECFGHWLGPFEPCHICDASVQDTCERVTKERRARVEVSVRKTEETAFIERLQKKIRDQWGE